MVNLDIPHLHATRLDFGCHILGLVGPFAPAYSSENIFRTHDDSIYQRSRPRCRSRWVRSSLLGVLGHRIVQTDTFYTRYVPSFSSGSGGTISSISMNGILGEGSILRFPVGVRLRPR